MIKAEKLRGNHISNELNFEIQKNSKAVFIFKETEGGEEFLKIIIGMKKPKEGKIFVQEKNLNELTRDEIFELRKKIAVIFKTGGLIQNLRAWENVVLPALYHKINNRKNITKKALEILAKLEFKKDPMSRVADLTDLEKQLVGIARALLMNPAIIIFEYPFDILKEIDKKKDYMNGLAEKIIEFMGNVTMIFIVRSKEEALLIENPAIIINADN